MGEKYSLETLCVMYDNLKDSINKKVDFSRFSPVEKIVYGMAGMILCGFLGALIALVFKQ